MEKDELIGKLNKILADEFEVELSKITPEANIKDTLMLNSLDIVDMIAVIEYVFGYKISTDDYKKIKSFAQLYDFLYKNIKH